MRPVDIIIKLMDSTADHAAIIKWAWDNDQEDFFVGLDLAISNVYDFGMAKIPEVQDEDDDTGDFSFSQFYHLAMCLANKDIQGDAATQAINQAALSANVLEWNLWYRRILLKTLHKYIPLETIQNELIRLTSG